MSEKEEKIYQKLKKLEEGIEDEEEKELEIEENEGNIKEKISKKME